MERPLGVAGRAVIHHPDDGVLVLQRSNASSIDTGLWELPGGKLEHGETLIDGLAREVLEETGLTVNPDTVVYVGHRLVAPFWVTIVTYDCGLSDEVVTLSDEHVDYAWVSMAETEQLLMSEQTRHQIRAAASLLEEDGQKGAE